MKNFKLQTSNFRETSNFNNQALSSGDRLPVDHPRTLALVSLVPFVPSVPFVPLKFAI